MNQAELRAFAVALFAQGVQAADPRVAVTKALTTRPLPTPRHGKHVVLAVGKAACQMMEAAMMFLPSAGTSTCIAVTNYENHRDIPGCQVFAAGHPTPDENGLRAGQVVMDQLAKTTADDHVLFLVSGGGSALLPAPVPGISLQDKIKVNDLMLSSGMDITEMNLVRQHLSSLKGGGLARMAAPATLRSLAISDVVGDDPRVIASGPTMAQIGDRMAAQNVLQSFGIWQKVPTSVQNLLMKVNEAPQPSPDLPDIEVIASNSQSLSAMVNASKDWNPKIITSQLAGDVSAACARISNDIPDPGHAKHEVLLWGGETTVKIKGGGKGGRNQELALLFAQENQARPGTWVFLSGGTDGRDGPTDAAGGVVDRGTCGRLGAMGRSLETVLANNDSFHGLQASGDLLRVGATGTNVADLMIFARVKP